MIFDTLYKIDNKGKIREWDIIVKDNHGLATIEVTHGAQNGQKQTKITTITKGKNLGKSNETTPYSQACLEAKSKWEKQRDKGYDTVISDRVFRPMLAHNYKDHKKKLSFPCYVQPKLDGLRCIIEWDSIKHYPVAYSRKGIAWKTVDHILDSVYHFLSNNKDIILDGELFTTELSFQEICSAVKRDKVSDLTKYIEFHCYDLYLKNKPEATFEERYQLIPKDNKYLTIVETDDCVDELDIQIYHDSFLEKEYEGSILRNRKGVYKVDGRSYDLLKYKDFQDAEFEIVGKELDSNNECVFLCLDKTLNEYFKCKPDGTHEERVNYYNDDNIGKMLTVKFFEKTNKGLPRFPVGKIIRDHRV